MTKYNPVANCAKCGTSVYLSELEHNHNNTAKWVCDYCLCKVCKAGVWEFEDTGIVCNACGEVYS